MLKAPFQHQQAGIEIKRINPDSKEKPMNYDPKS